MAAFGYFFILADPITSQMMPRSGGRDIKKASTVQGQDLRPRITGYLVRDQDVGFYSQFNCPSLVVNAIQG